ncbi:DUF3999 family protein [Marinicella meishanensis]|uniref:DUF3999 family protein n=1 Tax=Marinicella meishanensis TaxID=2873263 RepID=UPI001CBCCF94
MPLHLTQKADGYRLSIPAAVYLHAHNADLRDVRILNAAGDEVPIRITMDEDQWRQTWSAVTLPLFNLQTTKDFPINSQQVKTTWTGDQQSITVTTNEAVKRFLQSQEQTSRNQVLLDATVLSHQSAVALELDWTFATAGNRVFYVDLLGSTDLADWQVVLPRHKLVEVNTGQRVVYENRLNLPQRTHRYYQLRFHGPVVPVVNRVTAVTVQQHVDRPLRWLPIDRFEALDPALHGHVLQWDTGGHYPVEAVKLSFDYQNLMADVQLQSRPNDQAPWRVVAQSGIYEVGSGELSMFNDRLAVPTNHHRHWRLRTESTINSQWVDGIEMAWRAHLLQFLAQGAGPYTLVFGDEQVNAWPDNAWYQALDPDLQTGLFVDAVQVGPMTTTPEPVIEPETSVQEDPISRWVFWGLLTLVLMILLLMAVRLLREVASGSGESVD